MVYYFTRSLLFGLLVSWHFEDAFCFSPREMKEKKRKDKRNKEKSCSDQKSCRNLLVEFVDNHREIECSDKEAKKCPILCGVCTPPTTLPTVAPTYPAHQNNLSPSPSIVPTIEPLSQVTYIPGDLSFEQNGIRLSTGLTSNIIATSGQKVNLLGGKKSKEKFHFNPDGGAIFREPSGSGWVYVSNSEHENGGVGAMYFNEQAQVTGYDFILKGTTRNCGGGKTPWGTWLSCEESEGGQVWEVDPWSGHFHQTNIGDEVGDYYEAAAYDFREPANPKFFVTTDTSSGAVVRFVPDPAIVEEASKTGNFMNILKINSSDASSRTYLVINPLTSTFHWSSNKEEGENSARLYFPYSEGIDVRDGMLYFTVKTLKLLFILDLDMGTYESSSTISGAFENQPDQITRILGQSNEESILYFCEDGGSSCGVHGRDKSGQFFTILESIDYNTETTGLAFSPDKKHMYVSFQHNPGHIFDITREDGLPFDGATLDIKYHQI